MAYESIYGEFLPCLESIAEAFTETVEAIGEEERTRTGHAVVEHVSMRVKEEKSMRDKLAREGLEATTENALRAIHDAIGVRIVTRFINDIALIAARLRALPQVRVVREKDYVRDAKPNGYRSYHMILEVTSPFRDVLGREPGGWYVEVQLRTIAMDTWASLEHELKYKQNVGNSRIVDAELKRVADELASCDISMQTLRNLIRAGQETEGPDGPETEE